MSTSNMPPGCREADIPGNRAEDAAWEAFLEWANDEMLHLTIEEAERAVLIGVAAIKAEGRFFDRAVRRGVAEELDRIREDAIHAEEIAMEGGQ